MELHIWVGSDHDTTAIWHVLRDIRQIHHRLNHAGTNMLNHVVTIIIYAKYDAEIELYASRKVKFHENT